jgi:REP element-mobilizing transposase RayT
MYEKTEALASHPRVHRALRSTWFRHKNWIMSTYVVMPDHVHFFAEPGIEPGEFDDWITRWKRGVGRLLKNPDYRWQAGSFHQWLKPGAWGSHTDERIDLKRRGFRPTV